MTHMMSKVMWLYLKRAIYIFMLYVYVDCILGIFQLVLAATLLTGFINRGLLGYMISYNWQFSVAGNGGDRD